MTKKINRFYIGASHIAQAIEDGYNDAHTHEKLETAIAAAKKRVEEGNDTVVIVQIIRVVKRKDQPIIVERIR